MEIVKRLETEWAEIELTDTGVLVCRYSEGIEVDEHVARSLVTAGAEFVGCESLPTRVAVILDRVRGVTKEAREFFAGSAEAEAVASHIALVVGSPMARVIANFFLRLNKSRTPTRSFTSVAKAIAWLELEGRTEPEAHESAGE